jgi:hypothetical protein
MLPEYRYDEAWAKLKGGSGCEDLLITFPTRTDARRATNALLKRARAAGLRLRSKRVQRMPIRVRYRLTHQGK